MVDSDLHYAPSPSNACPYAVLEENGPTYDKPPYILATVQTLACTC